MSKPTVHYFGLGGTISSVRSSGPDSGPGVVPTLGPEDIAASAPGVTDVADLEFTAFRLLPSPQIGLDDLVALVAAMRASAARGTTGFVVSQGTDTIEETAYVLDLLWERPEPVVVTGAMRNPSSAGPDGPANLLAAVQVAASADARDLGVLVCLGEQIHAARFVAKTHTSSPAAFASPGLGPIGWVSEGRPLIALAPRWRTHIDVPEGARMPRVALVPVTLGDDGAQLQAVADLDRDGVVIAGMGGGHVLPAMLPTIDRLVARGPVVLASRAGAGAVLASTYDFPGSEIDVLARGVIGAGALSPLKARLLLVLCLAAGMPHAQIARTFADVGTGQTADVV